MRDATAVAAISGSQYAGAKRREKSRAPPRNEVGPVDSLKKDTEAAEDQAAFGDFVASLVLGLVLMGLV